MLRFVKVEAGKLMVELMVEDGRCRGLAHVSLVEACPGGRLLDVEVF